MSRAMTASPNPSFRAATGGGGGVRGEGTTPWSAEEMLGVQHQRVSVHAHAKAAHDGLPQKRPEENLW